MRDGGTVLSETIKYWWSEDGQWFCILVRDGVGEATVSLTPAEAKELERAIGGIYGQEAASKRERPTSLVEAVMCGFPR